VFTLRFDRRAIPDWAARAQGGDEISDDVVARARANGYLVKRDFLFLCEWKTPRTRARCATNSAGFIREVTAVALSTRDERLRIEVLTLLNGVNWPTASVILHFTAQGAYPILDVRALWSVGIDVPARYEFGLWWAYTKYCRRLARDARVTMRELDRALWHYSKVTQQ
jgi:hypothetical protein